MPCCGTYIGRIRSFQMRQFICGKRTMIKLKLGLNDTVRYLSFNVFLSDRRPHLAGCTF